MMKYTAHVCNVNRSSAQFSRRNARSTRPQRPMVAENSRKNVTCNQTDHDS